MLPVPFRLARRSFVSVEALATHAIALRRDDLRVDVLRRTVHAQPVNALQRDAHSRAARAALSAGLFVGRHGYFFFASLRTICSFV